MVKLPASAPNLPLGPLDSLVDLACRDGVEIRPTLLRVITDLYVQKPSHSPEEEDQFVELALGLIDAVDPLTRGTVTATLSAYAGAPEMVLRKLASLPLASRRGDAEGDDLIELFFDANTDERRLILTNLDVTADAATLRPMPAESELVRRLEKAARERNSGEFARVLERALGVSRDLATRITRDPFGEPLVVAGKALGMSADMLQRILLCLNPVIGQSVTRVFELSALFEDLNAAAVHRMLTIWRATAAQRHVVTRGTAGVSTQSSGQVSKPASSYAPVYWNDERRSARETATRTPARAEPTARPARIKKNDR
jgi:uncharacterized protein (DUF2336 family)